MPKFNDPFQAIAYLEGVIADLKDHIADQKNILTAITAVIAASDPHMRSQIILALDVLAESRDSPGAKDLLAGLRPPVPEKSQTSTREYLRPVPDDPKDPGEL